VIKIIEDDTNFHDYLSKTYLRNDDENKTKVAFHKKKQDDNQALPSITSNNFNISGANYNSNFNFSKLNTSDGFKSTFRERKRMENTLQNLAETQDMLKSVKLQDKNQVLNRLSKIENFISHKLSGKNMGTTFNVAESVNGSIIKNSNGEMGSTIKPVNTSKISNSLKNSNEFKKHTKSKSLATEEGQFLNTYKLEKIELTNKNVKDLFMELHKFGPAFQYCDKCNNKNLEYYQEMRPENAIKLLTHIKQYKEKKNKLVL